MGCRNSKTGKQHSPSKRGNGSQPGSPSTPSPIKGRARTLSSSDLDYMSDEDYGESDSDDETDREHGRRKKSSKEQLSACLDTDS